MKENQLQCPCCHKEKTPDGVKILINQMHPKGMDLDFDWLVRVVSGGYKVWACDDCIRRKKAIVSDQEKMNFSVTPKYLAYFDQEITCTHCKEKFIFSATEQQYWFETLYFWHESMARQCKTCRQKIRQPKEMVKRLSALLENSDNNTSEQFLEIAQIYTEMDKPEKAKHYTTLAKKTKQKIEQNDINSSIKPLKNQKLMTRDIQAYNHEQSQADREMCELLSEEITKHLPEASSKVWHAHPVWFLDNNPIVGYSKMKDSVRLLFWSGQSFDEPGLEKEGTFKAAEKRYTSADQIDLKDLSRWLEKAKAIQWDYKNIVKRKGVLERLK